MVLSGLPARITLRELIRTRIREEVAIANLERTKAHRLLVQPTETETTLNGYRLRTSRMIDWERQAAVAEKAFEHNGFFVIVDGAQVASLDDELSLTPETSVRFVKLTPLVGG